MIKRFKNAIRKTRNLKFVKERVKNVVDYAKSVNLNMDIMKNDIDIHLLKMLDEVKRANEIKPIGEELYNEYVGKINEIRLFIEKPTKDKNMVNMLREFDKKYSHVYKMIDERLGV